MFVFLSLSSVLAFPFFVQGSWQPGSQLCCCVKTQALSDGSSSCLIHRTRAEGMLFIILAVTECCETSAVLYYWSAGLIQKQNTCPEEIAERGTMTTVNNHLVSLFVLLYTNYCNYQCAVPKKKKKFFTAWIEFQELLAEEGEGLMYVNRLPHRRGSILMPIIFPCLFKKGKEMNTVKVLHTNITSLLCD